MQGHRHPTIFEFLSHHDRPLDCCSLRSWLNWFSVILLMTWLIQLPISERHLFWAMWLHKGHNVSAMWDVSQKPSWCYVQPIWEWYFSLPLSWLVSPRHSRFLKARDDLATSSQRLCCRLPEDLVKTSTVVSRPDVGYRFSRLQVCEQRARTLSCDS